jgi:hypothetical protein
MQQETMTTNQEENGFSAADEEGTVTQSLLEIGLNLDSVS